MHVLLQENLNSSHQKQKPLCLLGSHAKCYACASPIFLALTEASPEDAMQLKQEHTQKQNNNQTKQNPIEVDLFFFFLADLGLFSPDPLIHCRKC